MRGVVWSIVIGFAAGESAGPGDDPVEPATFAAWPKVTKTPVQVPPDLWALCQSANAEQERARAREAHGPHASRSIVVRVSPGGIGAYREGKAMPVGAAVVKEKYDGGGVDGPLREYAVMIKREPGYDPKGGDWEYAYVVLAPGRKATRGRLAECAGCHASAKGGDYLFRGFGEPAR